MMAKSEQKRRLISSEYGKRMGVLFIKEIIMIILLSSSVFLFSPSTFKEIKEKAIELNNFESIVIWVEKNIRYEEYQYPRSIHMTWQEKKGDCTDKAILKKIMLSNIGIKTNLIRGYVDTKKHDDIEQNINIFDGKVYYGVW